MFTVRRVARRNTSNTGAGNKAATEWIRTEITFMFFPILHGILKPWRGGQHTLSKCRKQLAQWLSFISQKTRSLSPKVMLFNQFYRKLPGPNLVEICSVLSHYVTLTYHGRNKNYDDWSKYLYSFIWHDSPPSGPGPPHSRRF